MTQNPPLVSHFPMAKDVAVNPERVTKGAKMTTKEPTSFDALHDAFEAAPEATRAEFLEWLARWRLANTQRSIAQLNPRARETWLEPLPWDDYE